MALLHFIFGGVSMKWSYLILYVEEGKLTRLSVSDIENFSLSEAMKKCF
jgi:hypothetical protein